MSDRRMVPRLRRVLLVAAAAAAGTTGACGISLKDIQYNIVNGTLAFVKAYSTGMWEALLAASEDAI